MAIYSLHHASIGRSTHAAGTAGAHAAYITRAGACSAVFGAHMPVPDIGAKGGEAKHWLGEQEQADRKNARVIDKLMLALPRELGSAQRVALVKSFVAGLTQTRAVPWLAAIHDKGKDSHNPHCHLIIRDRDLATGKRALNLSEKGSTERLRTLWEKAANQALEQAGSAARIDRRSLKAQRTDLLQQLGTAPNLIQQQKLTLQAEKLNRRPQGHEGPQARHMVQNSRPSRKLARITEARRIRPHRHLEAPWALENQNPTPHSPQHVLAHQKALLGALRAIFSTIITPTGWGGTFWKVLVNWGLVREDLSAKDLESPLIREDITDIALTLFTRKDRQIRHAILNDLNLPPDMDIADSPSKPACHKAPEEVPLQTYPQKPPAPAPQDQKYTQEAPQNSAAQPFLPPIPRRKSSGPGF